MPVGGTARGDGTAHRAVGAEIVRRHRMGIVVWLRESRDTSQHPHHEALVVGCRCHGLMTLHPMLLRAGLVGEVMAALTAPRLWSVM
ncbi:MAG: hypothetical protein ACSLE3_15305 [Microbacteriaceae bacterium]